MSVIRSALVCLALTACVAVPLAAQEPEDKLAALRTKDSLAEEDKAEVRRVVDGLVADVVGTEAAAAQRAYAQLRDGAKGTRDFSDTFVQAYLAAVGPTYKKAPAATAARLLTVLAILNDARSISMLVEALQDDRASVRAAAAIALRTLRPKVAADAAAYGSVLNGLRDAGKKETSRETLQLVYRSLTYADVPGADLKTDVAAMLDLLEARAQQVAGDTVPAEGADHVGVQLAGELRKSMDENDRKRYTVVLARLLHYGVRAYTGRTPPLADVRDKTSGADAVLLRNSIEALIADAELQLKEIVAPPKPPQVTVEMKGGKDRRSNMVVEMNKWSTVLKETAGVDLAELTAPPPKEEPSKEGDKKDPKKGPTP
jgi:hypothetical protein